MTMPVTGTAPDISALMVSSERFLNRELSWLRFNRRVIGEVENLNHSALELSFIHL